MADTNALFYSPNNNEYELFGRKELSLRARSALSDLKL